jgi:hypothetical protein
VLWLFKWHLKNLGVKNCINNETTPIVVTNKYLGITLDIQSGAVERVESGERWILLSNDTTCHQVQKCDGSLLQRQSSSESTAIQVDRKNRVYSDSKISQLIMK